MGDVLKTTRQLPTQRLMTDGQLEPRSAVCQCPSEGGTGRAGASSSGVPLLSASITLPSRPSATLHRARERTSRADRADAAATEEVSTPDAQNRRGGEYPLGP